jgi:archaellum component FlaC
MFGNKKIIRFLESKIEDLEQEIRTLVRKNEGLQQDIEDLESEKLDLENINVTLLEQREEIRGIINEDT